jgi:tetratricopeptide (TPR) repeat protein
VLLARIERKIKASPLARRTWESSIGQRVVATARAPFIWRGLAKAILAVRRAGLDHQAWSARAGRALLRAGDSNAAADAFAAALAGKSGDGGWRATVDLATRRELDRSDPAVLYGLGESLRRLGQLGRATTLIEAACAQEPQNSRWLGNLALAAEGAGNLPCAAHALERLSHASEVPGPKTQWRLARIYAQTGQWKRAEQILAKNVDRHPLHAGSHKDLSAAIEAASTWGGSFDATLPDRTNGQFVFGESPTRSSVDARRRAIELRPAQPAWRGSLASAQAVAGHFDEAISTYEALLTDVEASDAHWALSGRQKWQFGLELARHRSGDRLVHDPLFECTLEPTGERAAGARPVAGLFNVRLADNGLVVEGMLGQAVTDRVDIFVDGRLLRSLTPSAGYLPHFTLTIKRATVARFPTSGTFEARTGDAEPLFAPGGASHIEFSIPHGDGTLLDILDHGGTLEKKGEIKPSIDDANLRHDCDLKIYLQAKEFFDTQLGRPLFLLYGTLLGCHRDGDFIPGDDDFDVGYVSDQTTPQAVKDEAQDIIVTLVRAGFTVSFNRRGRLFRIHLDGRGGSDRHLDVQFVWFQNGNAWAHNQACLPASRDDFLPPAEGSLRGSPVWLPNRPEVFLSANYGPGWNEPDPGFRYYPSDVDPAVKRNLAKSLMTAGEYKKLAKRVEDETVGIPDAGRLVSLGSQSLYPLDEFIA